MLLETDNLSAWYGDFQALFGVDIVLKEGEVIAVIGANGAGKTTLLRSVSGLLRTAPDMIRLDGKAIGGMPADLLVGQGIAMVPEGRSLFRSLTVEENLLVGSYAARKKNPWSLAAIYHLFPILKECRGSPATSLSGGQQQMVAIGRALMSNPRVLLCDEISLGLAPMVIQDVYSTVARIKVSGVGIVIVEQDVGRALKAADRVYCMKEGRVSLTGSPGDISHDQIRDAYFGVSRAVH